MHGLIVFGLLVVAIVCCVSLLIYWGLEYGMFGVYRDERRLLGKDLERLAILVTTGNNTIKAYPIIEHDHKHPTYVFETNTNAPLNKIIVRRLNNDKGFDVIGIGPDFNETYSFKYSNIAYSCNVRRALFNYIIDIWLPGARENVIGNDTHRPKVRRRNEMINEFRMFALRCYSDDVHSDLHNEYWWIE